MPKAQSPWDDPKAKPKSKFAKFSRIGDAYSGVVRSISFKTFNEGQEDEATVPVIGLDDGPAITCSAKSLHRAMYELKPRIGDYVEVTFVGTDEENYGRKLFEISVDRSDGTTDRIDQLEEVPA